MTASYGLLAGCLRSWMYCTLNLDAPEALKACRSPCKRTSSIPLSIVYQSILPRPLSQSAYLDPRCSIQSRQLAPPAASLSLALASSRFPARGTRNGRPVTAVLGYFYRSAGATCCWQRQPTTSGTFGTGSPSFRCFFEHWIGTATGLA
jgi:hypothetical protein